MKLVDMKYTKEDKKAREKGIECSPTNGPDYPYGLSLNLDDAQLEKLGITSLPKVGSTMRLTTLATVVSARQSSREGSKNDRSIELQLRKIGVDTDDESAEDAVKSALKDA